MKAERHVFWFAKTNGDWPYFKTSFSESLCLRRKSACDVEKIFFDVDIVVPESLSEYISSKYNLLLMGVFVSNLVPHADFSSNNVYIFYFGFKRVHHSPMLIVVVCKISVIFSEAFIQISKIVVGEDYLIFPAWVRWKVPLSLSTFALTPHHWITSSSSTGRSMSSLAQ